MGLDGWEVPPSGAPLSSSVQREETNWTQFDDSVNAVSFGFVATALLISMFLFMAFFERFLRTRSTALTASADQNRGDLEADNMIGSNNTKPCLSSPKVGGAEYERGVTVVMPGEEIPTFIAHPSPPL